MISVQLLGGRKIRAAGGQLVGQVDRIEERLAEAAADAARDFVAVDTGATKANIRHEKRFDYWAVISDRGGDHGEVAIYLELGTRNMAARPYLRPAINLILAGGGVQEVARGVGGLLRIG